MCDERSHGELYRLMAEQLMNDGLDDVAKMLIERTKININIVQPSNTLAEEQFYKKVTERYNHYDEFSWDRQTSQFADENKIKSVLSELSQTNQNVKSAGISSYRPLYYSQNKQAVVNTNFSADGKYVAVGSADHTVKLLITDELNLNYIHQDNAGGFDLTDETELVRTFSDHTAQVNSVCFHPNNQFVFSASDDRRINFFKIKDSDKQFHNAFKHILEVEPVAHVTCHIGGKYLFVTTKRTPTIRLYDIETSACFIGANALDQHSMPVLGVGMNSDASVYISWSMDGNVKFWDGRSSRAFNSITAHNGTFVTSAVFKSDDYTILTSGRDNYVKLFDMRTSRCYLQVEVASQMYQNMNPAWFNAGQDQIFFVEDRNSAINSVGVNENASRADANERKIAFREAGSNYVRHFAHSPAGPAMVVASEDGRATLYHAKK